MRYFIYGFITLFALRILPIQGRDNQSRSYQWAIVGAGSAGIIALAVLLENNISPTEIIWFDPEFKVGRIGKYYRNVPANSRAQEMSSLLKSCSTFSCYSSPA